MTVNRSPTLLQSSLCSICLLLLAVLSLPLTTIFTLVAYALALSRGSLLNARLPNGAKPPARRRVLVNGGRMVKALTVCRALARAGCDVVLVDEEGSVVRRTLSRAAADRVRPSKAGARPRPLASPRPSPSSSSSPPRPLLPAERPTSPRSPGSRVRKGVTRSCPAPAQGAPSRTRRPPRSCGKRLGGIFELWSAGRSSPRCCTRRRAHACSPLLAGTQR